MNTDKIAAHHDEWDDLPYIPTPPGMLTTQHDGEMSLLEELADQICLELASRSDIEPDWFRHAIFRLPPAPLEWQLEWPDPAGKLLKAWKATT